MESILISIKKLLGIEVEYTQFDPDVIIAINTGIFALMQLGVGPTIGFSISDDTTKWADLLGDKKDNEGVKSYIYLKTRLLFDPPSNSFLVEAMERQIKELEWRINSQAETPIPVDTTTATTVEGGTV